MALRGLCSSNKEVKGTLLATLNETYFRTEPGKETFNYILKSLGSRGTTPAFRLLLESAKLTRSTREFLRDCRKVPKTVDSAQQVISTLNDYRRAFLFYESARAILDELENKKMDLEGLTESVVNTVTQVQTGRDSADVVFHFGSEGNASELVHEILYAEEDDQMVPTGYRGWDDHNGGFPRGSLVILAGSTGAGKSHNALQLPLNAAKRGYKTLLVPLEMTEAAMTGRFLANISGIDSLKILRKQLSKDEKTHIEAKHKKFDSRVGRKGGRFTIFKPASDVTIEALMASVHSYNCDMIVIDYISLLAGADSEDQWRKLGAMARYAARYADVHKKVVVLLAQVDEQDKIRYAKSIKEHAAIMWSFVATKETREQGILKFNVQKSRLQDSRGFTMKIDYQLSRVTDFAVTSDGGVGGSGGGGGNKPTKGGSGGGGGGNSKGSSSSRGTGMMPDLTADINGE